MKYFLLLSITICLFSCNGGTNKNKEQNLNDRVNRIQSLQENSELAHKDTPSDKHSTIGTNIVHNQDYIIDTILGDFHIYCLTKDNKNVVSTKHYNYADRSSILTISKNNRKLVSQLEIDKYNFDSLIPPTEINNYQLYNVHIRDVDDDRIILSFGIYQPDTDIGYPILFTIDSIGKLSAEIEEEIWEDDI